jgi:ribose 5-phosphate isomerase B
VKIAVAADHAGAGIREDIAEVIRDAGHEAIVLGAELNRPDDDYPIFAQLVGDAIAAGRAERAILICGSGAGVTVAANKLPGVRACVAPDIYTAHQMVEHDCCNVLTLGARGRRGARQGIRAGVRQCHVQRRGAPPAPARRSDAARARRRVARDEVLRYGQ